MMDTKQNMRHSRSYFTLYNCRTRFTTFRYLEWQLSLMSSLFVQMNRDLIKYHELLSDETADHRSKFVGEMGSGRGHLLTCIECMP